MINDPLDTGTGDGIDRGMLLRCAECSWSQRDEPGSAFKAAIRHAAQTGHGITYRGEVQDLSRYVRRRQGVA